MYRGTTIGMMVETQPLLRRRRTLALPSAGARVGVATYECGVGGDEQRPPLGTLPAIAFVVAFGLFLGVGVACTITPPPARTTVANVTIPPNDVKCYRLVRKADYVTVEYAIGGPTRRVQVLLRLDKVVGDSDHSVRIFSERTVESKSLQCDTSNTTCFDAILVTSGEPNRPLELAGLQFEYTNPTVEYYRYGVARYSLKLAGEMYAARGYRYYMTNTHLCVARGVEDDVGDTSNALLAYVDSTNHVFTNASAIGAMSPTLLGQSAVYKAYHGSECTGGLDRVAVMPGAASAETSYLAIIDNTMYESEPEAVGTRREIAELGYACANSLERFERAFNLYEVDCNNAYASCRTIPSLPFRRFATHDLRAHYTQDGRVYFWSAVDPTLESLPGLAHTAEAIWLALVKLAMLVLAAAVMWVRSDRVTSSAYWLYRHCIQVANCKTPSGPATVPTSVVEDAALGLVAMGARLAMALWRWSTLQYDNQLRVCVSEVVGSSVSFVSWVLRFWVIEPNVITLMNGPPDSGGPLTRLGGSMAIADASCAVLLAFAEPPIHLSAISRFDNTARLLTAVLVSLITMQRGLFATSCNAIMLEALSTGRLHGSVGYATVVGVALVLWLVQLAAIAVAIADLVATPLAFAITRGVIGDDLSVGIALFLALVCASLPRLMHTLVKLSEWDGGADK